jgi:hypothetical protein|nr:MAG TPA: hypothetical protein [Caudoviricetes sp.]
MVITIRTQSVSDIITNSSSETFIIQTSLTEYAFTEIWENILTELGYDLKDDTYYGSIRQNYKGFIVVDFPIICNLDEDVVRELYKYFGENNVEIEY